MASQLIGRSALLATAIATVTGCSEAESRDGRLAEVEALTTPAGPESSAPNLTVDRDGRVYLSWIELEEPGEGDDSHALRFAVLDGDRWSSPRTIASGTGWFVNWADFPTMTILGSGRLAAHYLQRPSPTGGGTYAYHIQVVQSHDGGETWSEPITPHSDRTPTEHGFVSLFPARGDSLGVVWLDGRTFAAEDGGTEEMSLRNVSIAADGAMGSESVVDGRTCECCQTSVALTDDGPIVAYRDRTEGEIRDIYVSRKVGARWSEGRPVHRDGWEINGCPVNGPSVASDGGANIVVAWFTGARDSAQVSVSFSEDRGDSFGPAIRVDAGEPIGRVDVEMLEDGNALVSWLENAENGGANVLFRRVSPDGRTSPPQVVTASSGARSSGFPQMAVSGNDVVFAWTESDAPARVVTARLALRSLAR